MSNFKVGDKVRHKAAHYIHGEIVSVNPAFVRVKWVPPYGTVYHNPEYLEFNLTIKTFPESYTDNTRIIDTTVLKQCECGKEKHGFANHTNWCPINE